MFFSSQLVEALKDDHKRLRTDIALLRETDISQSEREICFARFIPNLISHTKREEDIVYKYMKTVQDENLNLMAYEGRTKHMIADQLIEEMLSDQLIGLEWSATGKVLAELIEQHLDEEENDVFPLLKRHLDAETDAELALQYESKMVRRPTRFYQEFESEAPRWS